MEWDVVWQTAGPVAVKGGPVRQATLNLLLNASAATPEGGKVSFAANRADDLLTLSVGDEGPGLPPAIAAILTDRDPGPAIRAGAGFGAWMVRRTIDDLRATVKIDKKADGGTVITLLLPLEGEDQKADAA
jgi:signal transduction histidine kinase